MKLYIAMVAITWFVFACYAAYRAYKGREEIYAFLKNAAERLSHPSLPSVTFPNLKVSMGAITVPSVMYAPLTWLGRSREQKVAPVEQSTDAKQAKHKTRRRRGGEKPRHAGGRNHGKSQKRPSK